MADVAFGFVYDFGPARGVVGASRRGRVARTASGSTRRSASAAPATAGSRCSGSSPPTRAGSRPRSTRSESTAYRLRALGTIASSLCQVAAARFDGMVSLRHCRGVDAAAGQLIVREAAGSSSFRGFEDPLGAPLDATPHSPVVAARTAETLAELEGIPAP